MHHQIPSGDMRRKSTGEPLGQLVLPKRDQRWTLVESSPLNELIVKLCDAWKYTNRPLVRGRETPFFTNIAMVNDFFEFVRDNQNKSSFKRLCEYIAEHGLASCYADSSDDAERLCDNRVCSSREISNDMRLVLGLQDEEVRGNAQLLMRQKWGMKDEATAACDFRFYKMCLYEPGDHFQEPHRGSLHDETHFATVLVTMQSTHLEGGRISFPSHDPEEDSAPLEDTAPKPVDEYTTKMYVFYADTERSVEPVRQGHLVTFEYDILLNNNKVHHELTEQGKTVADDINTYLEGQRRVPALLLTHLYGTCQTSVKTLHGYDKFLYDTLRSHWGDIKLVPVIVSREEDKCEPLQDCFTDDQRQISFFIPPAATNCTYDHKVLESKQGVLESKQEDKRLRYTFMAMILNANY